MLQFVSFFILALFLVVSQTTLFHFLPTWLGRPDFIFIFVAFMAYRFSWPKGILLAFITGWMLDVVSGTFIGADVVECLFVFVCLRLVTHNSPVKESAYQIPLVGVSYFLAQLIIYGFFAFALSGDVPSWSWTKSVQETVVIVFASIPCFLIFNAMYEYVESYVTSPKLTRKRSGSGNRFR